MAQNFAHNGFNTLQEKLEPFKHFAKDRSFKPDDKSSLPPVEQIGADGVDHINIWEKGSTDLGVALSHMADLPFTHETYGKFRSIEGFWHYIRSISRDDRTRMMAGYKAKKFGDTLESQRVDDFKAIIMDANWQKIKQYPPLIEEIKNSNLPFDIYYLFNNDENVRIRPASAYWLLDGFNVIRKAIKEDTVPDFTFLKDKQAAYKKPNSNTRSKSAYRSSTSSISPALEKIVNKQRLEKEKAKPEQPLVVTSNTDNNSSQETQTAPV